MKQTAVEWLGKELIRRKYIIDSEPNGLIKDTMIHNLFIDVFEQAKEMHRKQIIEAHIQGHNSPSSTIKNHDAEQYYNETFKN